MSGISINKYWIKESDTLSIFLVSFIYGVYRNVSQLNISLNYLRRDIIIHRFSDREFVPLSYTFLKNCIKKKNDSFEKVFSCTKDGSEGIKAFPANTFWVKFIQCSIVKKPSLFAIYGSYATYIAMITTNSIVVGSAMPTNWKLSSGSG